MSEKTPPPDDLRQVTAEIDAIADVEDAESLERLQELIDQFFAFGRVTAYLEVWFRLFERFPEDDGYEMFWSILHGIEAQPGYESFVVESIRRKPSQFPVRMVDRMLNGGNTAVGETDLLELLRGVAADETCVPGVRTDAEEYITHQRRCG